MGNDTGVKDLKDATLMRSHVKANIAYGESD